MNHSLQNQIHENYQFQGLSLSENINETKVKKFFSSNKFVVTQRNIIPNWAPDQCGIFKMQYLFLLPPYPKNRSITFFF